MKLKTEMFNNKKYEIIDDLTIKIKSKSNMFSNKQSFKMMEGKFRIIASYKLNTLKNITLFLPEYISQMYSSNYVLEENNLEYAKIILTSSDLKHPINIKNKNFELFDNGFILTTKNVKIYPSYFFDKVVGFFMDIN